VAAEAGKHITLEGQEKDVTTAGLARMNMILHDFPTARSCRATRWPRPSSRTASALRTYDYVVANPPFSDKTLEHRPDPVARPLPALRLGRAAGQAGRLRLPAAHHPLAEEHRQGRLHPAARRAVPRQCRGRHPPQLVRSGILKGIIGLPANLFYGTGIPACILVLDKENATARKGVFMIDASKGFIKDGNKNRLREQDIHRIVDTFTRQATPRATRAWCRSTRSPTRRTTSTSTCRATSTAASRRTCRTSTATCAAASPAFNQAATRRFADWRAAVTPQLTGFAQDGHPKALIETIAEALLASFKEVPLLDAYDIYQHLMDYWAETMQDDAYLIAADGWVARTSRIVESDKKGKTRDKGWACDLIPKPYLVARYFASEQAAIEAKQAELEAAIASLAELEEEHGGEDAAFSGFDSITAASGEGQRIQRESPGTRTLPKNCGCSGSGWPSTSRSPR
jgi:type I restriction enzyme M protein